MDFGHSGGKLGFVYNYECIGIDGRVKWTERIENIIPDVGRDYLLNAGLLGGAQLVNWYVGLYENVRAPIHLDTMTTLMADCGEVTAYTSAGSLRLVLAGSLDDGVFSNFSTPAEFVFTADKIIKGGFVTSSAAQGSSSGTLLSAVQNSSPKIVSLGETLRVTAGLALITV